MKSVQILTMNKRATSVLQYPAVAAGGAPRPTLSIWAAVVSWQVAANHRPRTARPRPTVWCPESCQGFDCGVSEWGSRAATFVRCRINRKKTRWVSVSPSNYDVRKASVTAAPFSVFLWMPTAQGRRYSALAISAVPHPINVSQPEIIRC